MVIHLSNTDNFDDTEGHSLNPNVNETADSDEDTEGHSLGSITSTRPPTPTTTPRGTASVP